MAGQRQPIGLVIANGKKHLTKAEIEERKRAEVQPCTDGIAAPPFLTAPQKREFARIAGQLDKLGIMGETDCDTLGRYVVAESQYRVATKELRKLEKERPNKADYEDSDDPGLYYKDMDVYYSMLDSADKRQERFFKQASTLARDLGLTISSRCKLVVPQTGEAPKQNKFAAFSTPAGAQGVSQPHVVQ